jgi:hypothetical protein
MRVNQTSSRMSPLALFEQRRLFLYTIVFLGISLFSRHGLSSIFPGAGVNRKGFSLFSIELDS